MAERSRSAPLRVRITLVAVIVVGVALAAGSLLLVQQLNSRLTDSARASVEIRADSIASALSRSPGVDGAALSSVGDDDDEFIQILDRDGRVVAATDNMLGEDPVRSGDKVRVDDDHDLYIVADSSVDTSQGRRTVIVGASLEDVDDALGSVRSLLLIGFPAMVLIVGAVTWLVVGRTLAPVDRIRREAEEIGTSQLHRRLPEPERHDEIGRLTDTMNRMLERLDRGQKQQRQFVSDAAHELRSPIASIMQNLEVATEYPDHLSTTEFVDTVRIESTRLERLVVALLSLARLDERSPQHPAGPVDLDDLVFEETARLRQSTQLRVDIAGVSAGRVAGDPLLLAQALRNLVDNAQRHALGSVALTLREDLTTVTLTVEDDGAGVPPADRERVFERFVRLDEARARDDGGSGLGLAIVHTIVTSYDGSVSVDESPLGGARFVVQLPRFDEDE
ncbi:HAMP domain-containing sensor histidine kinase [Nocardioides salsibiostraticola]